jgi:hypothetical protein
MEMERKRSYDIMSWLEEACGEVFAIRHCRGRSFVYKRDGQDEMDAWNVIARV